MKDDEHRPTKSEHDCGGGDGDCCTGSVHQDGTGCNSHNCARARGQSDNREPEFVAISGDPEGGRIVALPTRRAKGVVSRSFVELELGEHTKDLAAFKSAYAVIHSRVLEVQDAGRLMKLVNWSGTAAVMGSLELTIHAIERTVEELKDLLRMLDAGAIIDSDER